MNSQKYILKKFKSINSILFFFGLIQFILTAEKIKDLKLNKTSTGYLYKDNSNEYYQLKIPPNIKKGSILVFTVKESRKGVKEGDELFSDPDIHVSKKNKYPKKKEEAEWYSQRYGNDILTIPSEDVKSNDIFYIGMYCEFKCRYELNAYLADEVEMEIGKIYSISLIKKSSLSYYINVPKDDYEELNLVATSPNLKSFKIFMSKRSPSSQNTFKIIPSWTGGYMISVERYTSEYCTNCRYHILIQSQEDKDVNIQFYAFLQDTVTQISPGSIIYDAVKKDKKRCYSYDLKNLNMMEEKILIQTTLFSGSALLYISGEKGDINKKLEEVVNQSYSYQIQGEKIIMLEKRDIDQLNSGFYIQTENDNLNKRILHFCIYGKELASYILNVYSLSDASKLQKYNYISPGTELTGYLNRDEVTRYRILDFNKNKNSNITITFTRIRGRTNFYATFCTEKCGFNKKTLNEKIEANEMMYPQETSYSTQTLIISPNQNKCYQKEDNDKCKVLLVMKCSDNDYDYCSYKILVTLSDQPVLMSPKKTYYNIIPKGKNDFYEIIVDDASVPSVVVVLTTVTGDAELTVYKKLHISDFGINEKNAKLFGMSMNNDYIPDVVRITPQKINENNISGRYLIKVTGKCFSSYNLYYYTTRNKIIENKPSINDISVSLTEGQIIRDFFPNDIEYKIYIYTPVNNVKSDIKIVLTRINVGFAFKVFNDFKKITILNNLDDDFEERIKGYLWASDQNNEVTISKNDKNYSLKKSYFIIVYKSRETEKEEENNNLNKKSIMMYYIGATKLGTPFTLYEVIEHSETLSDKYLYQSYWYVHNNFSESFRLDINVLSGEVDVFVSVNQLQIEKIINNTFILSSLQDSVAFKTNINNYDYIELGKYYFRDFCTNSKSNNQHLNEILKLNGFQEQKSCQLYIYIAQSKPSIKYQKDSQYIIAAKSSQNSGKILMSGQVISGEIFPNTTEHFFIEEIKYRKGSSINVKFTEGYGNVYVRIPKILEAGNNIVYPNETYYDFKGQNAYMGQVVILPPKLFDRVNSLSLKLQILITVVGSSFSSMNSKTVKFTISYSSEAKRINQNTPYTNYISAGEYQFYTLYFNKNTKNIYIALSNMDGDADLYLNYGLDKIPSPSDHDWYSVNMGHEYIDINENDKFFERNKIKSLEGYYSLLVVGFTETTYTLFVSSHDDKIFPLSDNTPISCRCESKGDKCFYRYDNIFKTRGEEAKTSKNNEIIFTTQYIYGTGKMYANIYKDQDITYEQGKKYQNYFPDEKQYQFSNSEFGKRNYLKVKVDENQYSKDSLILMTFICEEKTDVEITAASLSYNGIYNYLDKDRENIFYLKYNNTISAEKQIESIFTFFSYKEEDVIYEVKAYLGMARIKVYTNETLFNSTSGDLYYDYNHISEFTISADEAYSYNSYKIFTDNYINSIQKNIVKGKRIYFSVKPMSDFGFYLQIIYDRDWINIPINKDKSYLIKNDQMFGYFDIYKDFQNVEISISLHDFTQKTAKIYVKLIVLEKNSNQINSQNREDRLYHYEIPSINNYDYTSQTNNYLGTMNININNIPIIKDEDKDKKFVRALFGINIEKTFHRINTYDSESNYESNQVTNLKETNIRILVSPGVNNFKRIDVQPYQYYFSRTSLLPPTSSLFSHNERIKYNGNREIKIYSLDKINEKDDKMIIQINSCSGNYETKLSKKIVTYDDNSNDLEYEIINSFQGRKTLLIKNLKNKHVYLSIKSTQNEKECDYVNSYDIYNSSCSKELSYLLFYYSTSSNRNFTDDNNNKLRYSLDSRNRFILIIPQIRNVDKKDLEFNVIWTHNETYSKNMENICYLNQIFNKEKNIGIDYSKIFIEKNVIINNRNEIYVKSLYLSSVPLYINLLVRNTKNNELYSFKPLVAVISQTTLSFLLIIVIFVVIFVPCYFYYDEIKNKFMDFYVNGFSFGEIFGKKNDNIKYSNLSDNYY